MDCKKEYERWLNEVTDEDILAELNDMDDSAVEDAFYRDLAFGTGGLRGVIGAGTNRMNIYVVAKASQGLSNYLGAGSSVVIGYDSRIKSNLFAKVAAGVFAANGIKVHIWSELLPVPTVSYAIRYLGASQGIMITASHNPSKYNGYKVYGSDGCQITTEAASAVLSEIEKIDIFSDVQQYDFDKAEENGLISYIEPEVLDYYIEEIKSQSVLFGDEIDKDVSIVYSPLNGTGLKPVTRALEENGFTKITVVEEQKVPDGNFPTCPYPNPEIREAMELGLQYCEKTGADLLLATDPDADRCGIAVKTPEGGYQLLSGNEVGLLLLDYICSQRLKHHKMPDDPVFIKTIVTIDLAEKIAAHYGVRTINVLTGFKFIGEQIAFLEKAGKEKSYICGFEESYGYLTGSYVRDKDAVDAAYMICEMFAFYKTRGISLLERLKDIHDNYGYSINTLYSYEFDGSSGMRKMKNIMNTIRNDLPNIDELVIRDVIDYHDGIEGLPKSDVIKMQLEGDSSVIIRPSGTEPKIKVYISTHAMKESVSLEKEEEIHKSLEQYLFNIC